MRERRSWILLRLNQCFELGLLSWSGLQSEQQAIERRVRGYRPKIIPIANRWRNIAGKGNEPGLIRRRPHSVGCLGSGGEAEGGKQGQCGSGWTESKDATHEGPFTTSEYAKGWEGAQS
jgi:hypothetical protein